MSEKRSISVRIFGQDYNLRSDGDEVVLQRAAALLDEKMHFVNQRTKTADTLNIAVLAALNIARAFLDERALVQGDASDESANSTVDRERLRSLIELVESSVDWAEPIPSR